MGLIEKIFGKRQTASPYGSTDYKTLTAYQPVFTNYNGQMYENELVRAAIHAKATHVSKLKVEFSGGNSAALEHRIGKKPNSFQTWSQFLYRVETILENNNTAFICPIMDKYGRITEIFPVLPQRVRMIQVNNEPWVAFQFAEGRFAQSPAWEVGTLTKFQYRRDFFGESNGALDSTMKLIDIQNQGIVEGVKSSATFRFMAQLNNFAKAEDLKKERKRFVEENMGKADGGLLLFPNQYQNIQQIKSAPFVVDYNQMTLIQKNVFDYFGVNEDVLQGKAYGDAWTSFYESAIEPFAIQFSEVMTNMFYLCGEFNRNAQIVLSANRLQYMSNKEKLNVSAQMLDRGVMSINEIRDIWQLPHVEDGDERIIRGEYWNATEKINDEKENEDVDEN